MKHTLFASFENTMNVKSWIILLAGCIIALTMAGCDSDYSITPTTVFNYNIPPGAISTSDPLMKLFVNDYTKRVVYVGEEFEIKVVAYNIPPEVFATALDVQLNNHIQIESIMYDTAGAGYFAPKESTMTVLFQYPENPSKVSFVKSYLRGTSPHAGSRGILFKIRCRALSNSSGVFYIGPTNVTFRKLTGGGGVLNENSAQLEFTPAIQPVALDIRDDLFVP